MSDEPIRIDMTECGDSYILCTKERTEKGNVKWIIRLRPDENTKIGRLLKVVNLWLDEQGAVASVTHNIFTDPTLTAWEWGKY
jgi:hypothetical protein